MLAINSEWFWFYVAQAASWIISFCAVSGGINSSKKFKSRVLITLDFLLFMVNLQMLFYGKQYS